MPPCKHINFNYSFFFDRFGYTFFLLVYKEEPKAFDKLLVRYPFNVWKAF